MADLVINVDNLKLTVKSYPPSVHIVCTIPEAKAAPQLRPRVEEILAQAAEESGVSVDRILSPSREAEVVKARDQVISKLWHEEYMTTTEIGRIFSRDHSSIVASLHRVRAAAESSKPPG